MRNEDFANMATMILRAVYGLKNGASAERAAKAPF